MTMILIVVLIAVLLIWFVSGYNQLVKLKAYVQEGWSGIDVQLKRRADLIPNLVEVVKGYQLHERGLFEDITRLRAAALHAPNIHDKVEAEQGLTGALRTLFAVAENYPDLKASSNFQSLQQDLGKIEEELQLSRRYYNGAARNYNVVVGQFPSNIIAGVTGFKAVPFFETIEHHERERPKVQF